MLDSIKQAVTYLQLLSIVPMIIETVKSLEAAFPQPGQGPLKLRLLIETISLIWDMVPTSVAKFLKFEQIENFVTKYVGAFVKASNEAGVFQKPADTTVKAAIAPGIKMPT